MMTAPTGGYDRNKIMDDFRLWRPYLALVVAVIVLAVVVPGTRQSDGEDVSATGPGTPSVVDTSGDVDAAALPTDGTVDPTATGATSGAGPVAAAGGGAAGRSGARTTASGQASTSAPPALAATSSNPLDAPDCDKGSGRLMVPSFYAPNCVPMWPKGADNGGNTWQGVTSDKIVVAVYLAQENEQAAAIIGAAGGGSNTSDEEDWENRLKMIEAFVAHYETYGRKVEIVPVDASGEADDDAAAKADAIKVATEIKAFASFGAPSGTNAYIDELVARKVLCIQCSTSQPQEFYEKWAPYVWSGLMSSTQGYVHRAEYLCKKLKGGNAVHAGDPTYVTQPRKYGIVYYETAEGAYKSGVDFFETELAKCGIKLTDRVSYVLDLARAQEDSRVMIARMKSKGVTSLLFSGDPLMPIFLTKEATAQAYFPEWVITGSAITDTAFFARTYDQQQWQHAFGISYLAARVDPAALDREGDLYSWHYGQKLTSDPHTLHMQQFFTGVQLAGPKLTPQTFRDGMFSYKRTSGFKTRLGVSYGTDLWHTGPDYLSYDDATEIWWDPQAVGPDESDNRNVAAGLYRYVDGGVRYLPGQWPAGLTKAFDPAGTSLIYPDRPEGEKVPEYPRREGLRRP